MHRQDLARFGQHLITDIALPVLSTGYAGLLRTLRSNPDLAALARQQGADAVLRSDHPQMAQWRKGNKELVTAAEREAEARMMQAVLERFPDHSVLGEEHGYRAGGGIRWVFDPVDGTSAMLRSAIAEAYGLPAQAVPPAFGVTVGLVEGGEAVAGVVAELKPQSGALRVANLWVGGKDVPATCNGQIITPPHSSARLREATLACTVAEVMFNTPARWSGFQALRDAVKSYVPDQNCVGYMRLLEPGGGVDVVYEADLAYHDAAGLAPVLIAGGVTVTDGAGAALDFGDAAMAREFVLLAARPGLHAQALEVISQGVPDADNRFVLSGGAQGYGVKFPARAGLENEK